jgi:hypothetical protein
MSLTTIDQNSYQETCQKKCLPVIFRPVNDSQYLPEAFGNIPGEHGTKKGYY